MWSVGCILVELHTGTPIFSGADEIDQVYHQVAVLGHPPKWMLENGKKTKNTFKKHVVLAKDETGKTVECMEWVLRERKNQAGQTIAMPRLRTIRAILGVETGGPHNKLGTENIMDGHSIVDYLKFEDLVRRLLDWSPETRITPAEALLHPFFKSTKEASTSTDDLVQLSSRFASQASVDNDFAPKISLFVASFPNWTFLPSIYRQQLTQIAEAIISDQALDPIIISSLPLEHQTLISKFQSNFQNSHEMDTGGYMETVYNGIVFHDASQQCNLDKLSVR